MKFADFLYSVALFFIIITSTACEVDYMPQTETQLSEPSSQGPDYDEFGSPKLGTEIINPSTVPNPKHECLSANEFGLRISNVLSPEIFTYPNPTLYLLDQVVGMSSVTVDEMLADLRINVQRNRFPQSYVPYVEALVALLYAHSDLVRMRRSIFGIAKSSEVPIDKILACVRNVVPKLAPFYTSDVFADPEPPSRVVQKLLDMPHNDVAVVRSQLAVRVLMGRQVRWYVSYAEALQSFLENSSYEKIRKFYVLVNKS